MQKQGNAQKGNAGLADGEAGAPRVAQGVLYIQN